MYHVAGPRNVMDKGEGECGVGAGIKIENTELSIVQILEDSTD